MNNKTLERILQFRFGTGDYSIEQYNHAIDLFLTEYPDGTTIDKIDLVDISNSDSKDNDQKNIDVSESENCSNVESASSSNESDSDTD